MISNIYLNDSRLIKVEKRGRLNIYHLSSGQSLVGKKEIKKIEIECHKCKNKRSLKRLNDYNLKNNTLCSKCKSIGQLNPFYGKRHTQKTKKKISKNNKGKLSGNKNPMFGKSVFQHWIDSYGTEEANKRDKERSDKLSRATSGSNNPMYQKSITDTQKEKQKASYANYLKNKSEEDKEKTSLALSKSQKRLYQSSPEKYKEHRRKAGKASHAANGKYKKNKPEIIISDQLKQKGLDSFEYSIILDTYQFDFGCKKHKILLEVQGDYWHGNPKIYKELNLVQNNIKEKDKLKAEFAISHGFKLFYIWETEINNNDFTVLDKIKDIINEI